MTSLMNHWAALDFAALEWLRPLWLLALLPWVWLCWRQPRRDDSGNPWLKVIAPHLQSFLLGSTAGEPSQANKTRRLLPLMAGMLLILALAGPALPLQSNTLYSKQAATVVLFDLSASMTAGDLRPNRATRARLKLIDWLQQNSEGETALIAYAGSAHVIVPLTHDARTLIPLVQELSPQLMPSQGDDPLAALSLARELLNGAGYRQGELLWITDGFPDSEAAPLRASLENGGLESSGLESGDLRLRILAVGTESGAPGSDADGNLVRDEQGGILVARLDLAPLQALAADSGGALAVLSGDDSDLQQLASQAISNFQQKNSDQGAVLRRDLGPWLLLPALLLCFFSLRAPTAAFGLALLLTLPMPAKADWRDWFRTPDQQGDARMQAQQPAEAAKLYQDPQRRGLAEARAGQLPAAARSFGQADSADAHFNRGNALALGGQIDDALLAYNEALKRNPEHAPARANRAAVQQWKEQQPPPPPKTEQNSQQGNQADNDKQSGQGQGAQGGEKGKEAPPQNPDGGQAGQQPDGPRPPPGNAQKPPPGEAGAGQGQADKTKDSPQGEESSPGDQAVKNSPLWQQLPDDPGGLLRRKMQLEYLRRQQQGARQR